VLDAFLTSAHAGLTFFDTAEVYGHGESEKLVGFLTRKWRASDTRPITIASKFALLPGRDGARSLLPALDASLKRMGLGAIDLHQVHWPDKTMATIDALMAAMADAVRAGKVRAVGVSNFSADELRHAHRALASHGLALASNQVHYSLLHRAPEVDGVLEACRELNVALLAYSPLEMGLLTGKYSADRRPGGRRSDNPIFGDENVANALPVIERMRAMATARSGATVSQVALNWLRAKPGVVPLPGAKNAQQAGDNAGALGWSLTADEVSELDAMTRAWCTAG
jgi:aryl-alcohol dehydrogenase-like predicted oxidoreductase